MEFAGVSGTVTVDQRLHNKFESLRGNTPAEIHSALREVRGDQTEDCGTVCRWAARFREGRVTIQDDPRPGRSET